LYENSDRRRRGRSSRIRRRLSFLVEIEGYPLNKKYTHGDESTLNTRNIDPNHGYTSLSM